MAPARRLHPLLSNCPATGRPAASGRWGPATAFSVADLQRLDDNGYSGHLSFILHMLDTPRFLATYQAGEQLKAVVGSREYNGRTSYTVKKIIAD